MWLIRFLQGLFGGDGLPPLENCTIHNLTTPQYKDEFLRQDVRASTGKITIWGPLRCKAGDFILVRGQKNPLTMMRLLAVRYNSRNPNMLFADVSWSEESWAAYEELCSSEKQKALAA